MVRSKRSNKTRRGAQVVEMAAVAVVFLMLLFGILEYCRLLFFRQVLFNAAREGARYAVVNVTDTTMVGDTQTKVLNYMNKLDQQLTGYKCNVYLSDSSGNNIGAAGNANFGQYVAVEVYGTYSPILPTFLYMNKTFKLYSRTLMYSEAN